MCSAVKASEVKLALQPPTPSSSQTRKDRATTWMVGTQQRPFSGRQASTVAITKNLCVTVIVIYLFRFESADTRFRSSATLGGETIELENVIKLRLRSSPHAPRMLNFLIDEFQGCQ